LIWNLDLQGLGITHKRKKTTTLNLNITQRKKDEWNLELLNIVSAAAGMQHVFLYMLSKLV
jgi:hypothetical protein